MDESLISAGIDVGTATTKIVISRLRFANQGLAPGLPRIRLVGREILHRSQLAQTPVVGQQLQGEELLRLVRQAYQAAGIAPSQVGSGGVIITGESARKENAQRLVHLLAREAGDFVVATAGPHLEAVLAGRGSGAALRSEATGSPVAGVDIGGGTTNIAVFQSGSVQATACLNLGGKALRLDPRSGRLLAITPVARALLAARGLHLGGPGGTGRILDWAALQRVGAILAEAVAAALASDKPAAGGPAAGGPAVAIPGLYDGPPLSGELALTDVILSGGVGSFASTTPTPADALRYGDIGPALGWALPAALAARGLRLLAPAETAYATVIGVGVHTLHLSGSTIRLRRPELLPLRNLPVLKPFPATAPVDRAAWAAELPRHLLRQTAGSPVAVAVAPLPDLSYDALTEVAQGIRQGMAAYLQQGLPLVVVAEQDVASSLGLLLGAEGGAIVVDELTVADGDYIDIGQPLYGGAVVPVVIKTLVFGG